MNVNDTKTTTLPNNSLKSIYKYSNNIIGNCLNNDKIKQNVLSSNDQELVKYLCEIISYQNYIEGKLKLNNNHLSLNFAQILSNLTNKKLEISAYDDLNSKKILIDVNYFLTYIHNIYKINKNFLIQNFDASNIAELKLQAKKDRLLYKEQQIKHSQDNAFNIRKTPDILRKDFYPFMSKSKYMLWIKYFLIAVLAIFPLLVITTAILSKNHDQIVYFSVFIVIFSSMSIFYIFQPIKFNVLRIKYTFNIMYLVFINIPIFIGIIVLITQTFGFSGFKNIFHNSSYIVAFVAIIIGVIIIITTLIGLLISPKLNKEMLEKAKLDFIKYQQKMMSRFTNNPYNNFNSNNDKNDEDSKNNKDN